MLAPTIVVFKQWYFDLPLDVGFRCVGRQVDLFESISLCWSRYLTMRVEDLADVRLNYTTRQSASPTSCPMMCLRWSRTVSRVLLAGNELV